MVDKTEASFRKLVTQGMVIKVRLARSPQTYLGLWSSASFIARVGKLVYLGILDRRGNYIEEGMSAGLAYHLAFPLYLF